LKEEVINRFSVRTAIIAVPDIAAQLVCDQLVEWGLGSKESIIKYYGMPANWKSIIIYKFIEQLVEFRVLENHTHNL
jgi:NADH/NAD ratio-sensing transcriptional regulator Rex